MQFSPMRDLAINRIVAELALKPIKDCKQAFLPTLIGPRSIRVLFQHLR
jgi:hypothetical protein